LQNEIDSKGHIPENYCDRFFFASLNQTLRQLRFNLHDDTLKGAIARKPPMS